MSFEKWSRQNPCKIPPVLLCVYLESVFLQSLLESLSCALLWDKHAFSRRSFSSPQSLAGSQTCVSSTTRGQKITFGDCLYALLKETGAKGEATWELIRGWGILVHPSPNDWAYLQPTSFIGVIFSSLHMR